MPKKSKDINDTVNKPNEKQNNEDTAFFNVDNVNIENIGMKKSDPSSHSNIAQMPDVEEVDNKAKYESQQKKKKLGLHERIKQDQAEKDLLDTQILSKDLIEKTSRGNSAERFNPDTNVGLTLEQVDQRIKEDLVNDNQKQYTKSYRQIFINNIFTFFNVLCFFVAAALIYVAEYKNLVFMAILTINTVIGIVQEIKAKKTIEKLSIVTAPTVTVIRNSLTKEIQTKELVLDDIVKFKNGNQIAADCIVINGEIEVNESLLTGESVSVKKSPGDTLFAGSFITSGSCNARVDRVGQDCYIQKLQAKAKRYSKPKSELLRSLKIITTFITIVIVPLGSIMAYRNYDTATENVRSATFGTSGSLVVYGVDDDKNSYEIHKFDKVSEADSTGTNFTPKQIPVTGIDPSPKVDYPITQIKISYDSKVTGNISIRKIDLYEAKYDETTKLYNRGAIKESWTFDSSNKDSDLSSLLGIYGKVGKYNDGTLKLDSTGSYIITKTITDPVQQFYLVVELQSRAYGFDPGDEAIIEEQIIRQTVTKTAGSLVGMIPAGLFLLVTVALAISVVRLAKSKTLVQELYCIEMLARVDCICLDKTGTITDGTMRVKDVIETTNDKDISIDIIMGAFIGALDDNNLTSIALQDKFGVNFEYKKIATVPFSSARKMSAVTFEDKGTFILGAPEFIYQGKSKKLNAIIAKKASMGYRVLMLARSSSPIVNGKIPLNSCSPIALITLEDHIREEAFETIKWFKENDVQVKVISGDNPATVAEIAAKVGIDGAEDYISLDGLSPQEVETIATEYTVFGRVSPDQKAILIRTLKRHGKTVAMTGDGVNDILAMKESDCSVAMASGSDAARSVAHLVLLDSNFSNMPKVVLEGRRVINNIQQSSSLYLMKTLFVMVITFLSIIAKSIFKTGYPFEPIQFTLLESFVIGLPSIILAIQPNKQRIKGNFIANIISNCVSQAFCLILAVVFIYTMSAKNIEGLDLTNQSQVTSICVITITYIGVGILVNLCRPFNTLRIIVCVFSFLGVTLALFVPEIAKLLGVTYQFNDLSLTNKFFTLLIILAIFPLDRGLSDLIKILKNRTKKEAEIQNQNPENMKHTL